MESGVSPLNRPKEKMRERKQKSQMEGESKHKRGRRVTRQAPEASCSRHLPQAEPPTFAHVPAPKFKEHHKRNGSKPESLRI